jgi:hypothetical protein
MKHLKIATIIIASIGVMIFSTLAYNGAFKTVVVQKGQQGGHLLIGLDHKGSYQKIATVFDKVKQIQQSEKLDSSLFVGVYFDDPASVEEEKLRSFAGFAIKDSATGLKLLENHPNLHFQTIEKRYSYFTEMETPNMISMILAVIKAYPALGEKIKEDNPKTSGNGLGFEEYHQNFTRFVLQVE